MMRVLFLDIDGVLNSNRTAIAFGGYPHDVVGFHRAMFDEVALVMIRNLCLKANISIVVSSSWRIDTSWDHIGRGLDLPTIGQTPVLPAKRGEEIKAWLDAHPEVVEYAIIDDDGDMLTEQESRFVHVRGADGVSFSDFNKLCGLFGTNPYDCSSTKLRERAV